VKNFEGYHGKTLDKPGLEKIQDQKDFFCDQVKFYLLWRFASQQKSVNSQKVAAKNFRDILKLLSRLHMLIQS